MKQKRPVFGIGAVLFLAIVLWALFHAGIIG
jgi:hypothetical protein